MYFTESQLKFFSELSHDNNSLHLNQEYAHRTPFAQRVFYGCAAVFWLLGHWAKGRRFQLQYLKVDFKKPLFLGKEYYIETQETETRVIVKILKEESICLKLIFDWTDAFFNLEDNPSIRTFSPRTTARIKPSFQNCMTEIFDLTKNYQINLQAVGQMRQHFNLDENQIPLYQIEALAWSSYIVGMEIPGRQALFTNLEINFDLNDPQAFQLKRLNAEVHEQFKHIEITGTANNIPSFKIVSWIRPEAIEYSLDELKSVIGCSKKFKNKTVLITGGSRGFGSVLARGFAMHGADIIINYVSSKTEALTIQQEIKSMGQIAVLAPGDLSTSEGVEAVRKIVKHNFHGIDILVNNAMKLQPLVMGVKEQTAAEVVSYVQAALGIVIQTSYGLIPELNPKGVFITISSVAVPNPEQKFSAYITAKSAVEGWTRALAVEMPQIDFLIIRPPRMLTDATNTAQLTGDEHASAATIARWIFNEIFLDNKVNNLRYLDFWQ